AQGEVAVARRLEPTIVATMPDVVLVAPGDGPGALTGGDRVVVTSLEEIADGARIRVLPAAGPAEGR
ncbi:MAG: hypothetical protein ACC662_00785, partial [Planctomycetota bacterium]